MAEKKNTEKKERRKPQPRDYSAAAVQAIEPPARTRVVESSIPAAVIAAMVAPLRAGNWATNGVVYDEKEDAQLDAAKFKRALSRANLNGVTSEKDLATRTWETDDGGTMFAVGIRAKKSNSK